MSGTIYLIPTYLSDSNDLDFVSDMVKNVIRSIDCFLVENARTARRYISSLKLDKNIEELIILELAKSEENLQIEKALKLVLDGKNLGIISEAGLPAIADPGQLMVQKAHQKNIKVSTLPGASSMVLGLVGSGFNGQQYTFHGYLPIDEKEKINSIRHLEKELHRSGYTQLFMETPYRNDKLLKTLLNNLSPSTFLFIGSDLTGKNEFCLTKSVRDWKKEKINIGKIPTIFAIGKF
jgi:16S rRNA (cytidine1402-2'-O)-methyltransferase